MTNRRIFLQCLPALTMPALVFAQEKYPTKDITWICPYAPGGNADGRSRQMAKAMGPVLGGNITVDNKAGAGGNTGTAAIATAAPDCYTIGMGNFAPLAVNQALFKKLTYDPQNDLVPIMLIERGPLILMVGKDSPYKSVKDIVAAAKATPHKLTYASGGVGGTHHLSAALLASSAGVDLVHVPYRSGAAGTAELVAGQVAFMFEQMYAAMPSLKSGKLRALAITSKTRSPLLPDLPTMAEAGFPAVEVLNWQGIVGPKGLSADIVKALNRAGNKALTDAELRENILSQGNEVGGGTPEAFAALIKAEAQRWGKVVKDAKIEME